MPDSDFQRRVLESLESIDRMIRGDGEDQPGILMRLDRIEQSENRAKIERQVNANAAKARSSWVRSLLVAVLVLATTNIATFAKLISLAADVVKK